VEKKLLKQWWIRITAYAERLLKDLDLLDWPADIKEMTKKLDWQVRRSSNQIYFKK